MPTKIEWCEETWNPVTGCTKVSEGCQNCYAERIHNRFNDTPFSQIQLHPKRLKQPSYWRKPRRIFVCSMGDLYHENIQPIFRRLVFNNIDICHQHTFLILTKRPKRMYEDLCANLMFSNISKHLPNLWLGVSVENQQTADERIPVLLQIPAAMRFVSVEPMLEEIDIKDCINGINPYWSGRADDEVRRERLDWVICGSESGPKRRECKVEWIRSLRDQCFCSGIPFFLKQMDIDGKLVKMPELDGKVWKEYPN